MALVINLMKKGDEFVGLYGNLIAIRKPDGVTELTEIVLDEKGCIRLEKEPKIVIGYGDNVVSVSAEDGKVEISTF